MNTWCTSNIRSGYLNPYFSSEQYLKIPFEEHQKIKEIKVYERLTSKYDDDLKFLFCFEQLGRLIYTLESVDINFDVTQQRKKVIIIGPIKRLITKAIKLKRSTGRNYSITNFGEISGKAFSPFVNLIIQEYDALEKILQNKNFDDRSFIDLLFSIQVRFKSEYKRQIDNLDNLFEEQVNSYLSYFDSLSKFYPHLIWVKVNLHLNFRETLSAKERLLLIGSLSRSFAQKIKSNKQIFKGCVGYICSLNILSELNPWAEMILFLESDNGFSNFQIETIILEFWLLYTNAFKPAAIVFSGSHSFEEDADNKSPNNQFAMSLKLLKLVVHLVTRHQFLAPKIGLYKKSKLVTRGAKLRRVRSASRKS